MRLPVPENVELKPIKAFPAPDRVLVPLTLDPEQSVDLLVKKGKNVKEGEIIGQGVSSVVLATISGKIEEVNKDFRLPNGERTTVVSIQAPEDEALVKGKDGLLPKGSLEKIIQAGVYDYTGRPAPLLDKLAFHRSRKIKTLIVSCLDEFFVQGRTTALLHQHGQDVLDGIDILKGISGAQEAVIVVYAEAVQALEILNGLDRFKIVTVQARHPQHKEQLLVTAVTGNEYPAELAPEDFGVTTLNAETAYNAARAINHNRLILDKLLTVAGSGLEEPVNCFARIGTPLGEVLEGLGLDRNSIAKLILGGPLSGVAVSDLETPVTQEMDLIFLQGRDDLYHFSPEAVCFKCGYCVEICPMRLMPFFISGFSEGQDYELAEKNDIFSCIECGCCAHVCPVHIPLVQWIQLGKSAIRAQRS
ncbi:MAG: RnfABCDGE type electron transport complex subunit C [Desulfohalobiaceae bacterium]|nr:RnfABCDGE type electron transport complex subunit C [Desulfohalobiaceae bacterium]